MKTKYWAAAITIILIFIFSIAAGYFVGAKAAQNMNFDNNEIVLEDGENVSGNNEKIYPYTQIVYEYYYPYECETETKTFSAPNFMVGLTLKDMNEYYYDWQVTYFSSQKVVMRKTIYDEKNQRYIVGEKDGVITVFYEEDVDGKVIKEQTNIIVSALPEGERAKLEEGIKVLGEESLIKVLQDFGS